MGDWARVIGRGGLMGLLIGFGVASWVAPGTKEGYALLLVLCALIGVALSLVVSWIRAARGR